MSDFYFPAPPSFHQRWVKTRNRVLLAVSVLYCLGVGVYFVRSYRLRLVSERSDPTVEGLRADLERSQAALAESLRRATIMADTLVANSRRQQDELARVEARYTTLKALTAGQEEIARTYRSILTERTWRERVTDLAVGLLLGVASSIVASWLWSLLTSPLRQ